MKCLLSLLFLYAFSSFAQTLEAPKPEATRKQLILANVIMYGSSVVGAHATAYGTRQCYLEDVKAKDPGEFVVTAQGGGTYHPWRRSFSMSLPSDAVISLTSFLLSKKHHHLMAVVLPSASAATQLGIAGVQYSEGCF